MVFFTKVVGAAPYPANTSPLTSIKEQCLSTSGRLAEREET
jgi:hypothetical protein